MHLDKFFAQQALKTSIIGARVKILKKDEESTMSADDLNDVRTAILEVANSLPAAGVISWLNELIAKLKEQAALDKAAQTEVAASLDSDIKSVYNTNAALKQPPTQQLDDDNDLKRGPRI